MQRWIDEKMDRWEERWVNRWIEVGRRIEKIGMYVVKK